MVLRRVVITLSLTAGETGTPLLDGTIGQNLALREGAEPLTADAVRAFCAGRLVHYKIPLRAPRRRLPDDGDRHDGDLHDGDRQDPEGGDALVRDRPPGAGRRD